MAPSSSRNGARVLWVVVHTAEGIRKASDLKAFFDRSTNSSAHACADDATLLDNCVDYSRAAWTLRNGNVRSDNLELCGFASWTRAEWLTNHQGMLNHAAQWIRSRCLARGIPIVKLAAADVRAGRSGVIGHVDYTNGANDGSHWDPGPNFPWDVVMSRATQNSTTGAASPDEEDDVSVKFLKGDSTTKRPEGGVYGDVVFKVEFAHDGLATAVRTRVLSASDPGYLAHVETGGKVYTVRQAVLNAIPDKVVKA